jgi:hypothetical protein
MQLHMSYATKKIKLCLIFSTNLKIDLIDLIV